MRTILQGADVVYAFDEKVWLQENQTLRFNHTSTTMDATFVALWTSVEGSRVYPLAKYTLDENRKVVINVSDILRVYNERGVKTGTVYLQCNHSASSRIDVTWQTVGNINPESVIRPDHMSGEILMPPSVVFAQVGNAASMLELYCKDECSCVAYDANGEQIGIGEDSPELLPFIFSRPRPAQFFFLTFDEYPYWVNVKPLECGHRYAAVRWVSLTGKTRCNTWEIVKSNVSTRDAIEMLTADGTYKTIKGREDGFTLMLDGLSAYDYWYYSDIITSSKVEVSLDGTNWYQVEVVTKDSTLPDGDAGQFNKLEIKVNYRKYDAVTM